MSENEDQIRDSEYDGIQEYDNSLPNWWLGTFFLTILFAGWYWLHYYSFETGSSQTQEYQAKLEAHDKRFAQVAAKNTAGLSNASLAALVKDAAAMASGKSVFMTHCLACHGSKAEGGIGPNMTDEYWIHGGSPMDIHSVIVKGVPEKGMISWTPVLTAKQIQEVSAFILTLQGTNPPNAKAAQGDKYVPEP